MAYLRTYEPALGGTERAAPRRSARPVTGAEVSGVRVSDPRTKRGGWGSCASSRSPTVARATIALARIGAAIDEIASRRDPIASSATPEALRAATAGSLFFGWSRHLGARAHPVFLLDEAHLRAAAPPGRIARRSRAARPGGGPPPRRVPACQLPHPFAGLVARGRECAAHCHSQSGEPSLSGPNRCLKLFRQQP